MSNIMTIGNVRGYIAKDGNAWLNAEDVARGWGFTTVATSGNEVVRWARVNEYLKGFGFSPQVAKDDFLPENMVYRLGFKANNERAQAFQSKLADEILPAIRKTGSYTVPKLEKNPKYRTRMIGTAVRDVRSTAAELQKLFGVKDGIALAKATSMIERAYGVEMPEVKELIPPAEHDTGFLNPTAIGAKLGISAKDTNLLLKNAGLQMKIGKEWRITNKGKNYGEEMLIRSMRCGTSFRRSSAASSVKSCKSSKQSSPRRRSPQHRRMTDLSDARRSRGGSTSRPTL